MRRVLASVPILLVLTGFTGLVRATVILPAEFREVVAGSDVIAHVQIADVRPEWAQGRRRIDSLVTAVVVSYLKGGQPAGTITFQVPGGELGRYRSIMIGAPVFSPGDEAVLFLNAGAGAPFQIFGLNQGVFRVRPDPVSGRRMVVSPVLLSTSDGPERVTRGSAARRALALEEFGTQVRTLVAQAQAVRQ
ncbi:MAG TPA: hypothetical protein VD833_02050 [Vicinamibacterales bacterium]|nr:hypothetical protein [Vicinamibacterales bacterium]